jgi:hypothetical protein
LELLHFWISIRVQGAHNFSIAQSFMTQTSAHWKQSPG